MDYSLCGRCGLKEMGDCKVVTGESVARQHQMVVCRKTLVLRKRKREKVKWKVNMIFEREKMLEELRKSVLVPIFKTKGYVQSRSSYREMKLMSHTKRGGTVALTEGVCRGREVYQTGAGYVWQHYESGEVLCRSD